jgi:predicted ATPase/class 3 adenylate cyclase
MTAVRRDLPSGTVTFLFTDIEGSTKLLHELGADRYSKALAEHRRILREAFTSHGGVEVDTQGDAFFVAFPTASGALEAAMESREALASGPIRVRMGVHTGTPHLSDEGYVGQDVHKGARIGAAGHGGQVLLSKETHELAPVDVTDLGEHRLKDFDEPVWIFQLGSERFPPLKTISNTNLPRPASSFVGRDKEVDEVVSLLQGGARLLTLTGPGGSGKTRLAIEAAAEVVPEFKAGVFWVGLAPLRDPALVVEAIGRTLGAKDGVADHIGKRELLLLLDNLEQVIEAAPELASLVESCANLTLLVTSRELLRVRGEVEYPVLPLADPEAVELFCARARAEADEVVHDLCRALDNLPLALELAAARASVLSPKQILDRLSGRLDLLKGGRDADPRQQTLRATIEWSYELLGDEERSLFARLAVFAGGCTLGSADEVVDADLDTLQSLVEKSLLRRTEDRFWMLETIREYASERLDESGEADDVRRRYAEHYLAFAENAPPNMRYGPDERTARRLEAEHPNLRAALDALEASEDGGLASRLAAALWPFWRDGGHMTEGRRRLETALQTDTRASPSRAKVLNAAAEAAVMAGDGVTSRIRAEDGLALHRTLGDAWGVADSLWTLGFAVASEGDFEGAQPLLHESIRTFRDLGDELATLYATRTLAWTFEEIGDVEQALTLYAANLDRARTLGDSGLEAMSLRALGGLAVDRGRAKDALSMLAQSHAILSRLADVREVAVNLCEFARALAAEGRVRTAARLLSGAEAVLEELGAANEPWIVRVRRKTMTAISSQLDAVALSEAWEEGRTLTPDEVASLDLDSLTEEE